MNTRKTAVGVPFWAGTALALAPCTYLVYNLIADEFSLEVLVLSFSVSTAPAFLLGSLIQAAADFHKKAVVGAARPKHSLVLILIMTLAMAGGLGFSQLTEHWQGFTRDAFLCLVLLGIIIGFMAASRKRGTGDQ
jgi:hypothetical protein